MNWYSTWNGSVFAQSQIFLGEYVGLGQGNGLSDGLLQLPNISRPGIGHDCMQGSLIEPERVAVILVGEVLEKVLSKKSTILWNPLTQRG